MNIPSLLIILSITVSTGAAQEAKYSDFTTKQLAKHLGLSGGNWTVSFDQKLYCGFILLKTSRDGTTTRKYYWSSSSSKVHQFHFLHNIKNSNSHGDLHQIHFSSSQEGEWVQGDDKSGRSRFSVGAGYTNNTHLPSVVGSEQSVRDTSVKINKDSRELLYSWSSDETKQGFSLKILFTKDKKKAEQDAAPNH